MTRVICRHLTLSLPVCVTLDSVSGHDRHRAMRSQSVGAAQRASYFRSVRLCRRVSCAIGHALLLHQGMLGCLLGACGRAMRQDADDGMLALTPSATLRTVLSQLAGTSRRLSAPNEAAHSALARQCVDATWCAARALSVLLTHRHCRENHEGLLKTSSRLARCARLALTSNARDFDVRRR